MYVKDVDAWNLMAIISVIGEIQVGQQRSNALYDEVLSSQGDQMLGNKVWEG